MTNFKMEKTHFISLPGFAFQAFLKTTNVHLGHITDPELFDMLSNNLRGGHSFSSQRYEESSEFKNMSNTNTTSTFNDIPQHLLYIDANNFVKCINGCVSKKYTGPIFKYITKNSYFNKARHKFLIAVFGSHYNGNFYNSIQKNQ